MSTPTSAFFMGTTVRGKIYRILIALFSMMLICTAGYLAYSQRTLVEQMVKHQTTDLADSYFDNINTLMLTGGMANRDIPRKKLLSRPEVLDARIIRGAAVQKIYGPGTDYAKAVDDLDRRALSGETISLMSDSENGRVLTVLRPLAASKDFRGTDCISCHLSAEGDILGAVRVDYSLSALDAAVNRDLLINIAINSVLMVLGLIILGLLFTRIVSNPLKKLNAMMHAVAQGNADWSQRLCVSSDDEIGTLAGHFNCAIEKFGNLIENTKQQSDEATRLKTALDCVNTNVMVADKDFNIIYLNDAVRTMFEDAESDIRESLPRFKSANLIGSNIDLFHAKPDHQRHLLTRLDKTFESELSVGTRTFRIIANPVVNAEGDRLGTAVEWADLTADLKAAEEEAARLAEERRQATENLQIRTALDNVSSSVMLADQDYNIIYANKTLGKMFDAIESDLRQAIPGFDASALLGSNMDAFHRDPAHQRRMLDQLQTSVDSEMEVSGLTLKIVANPVVDNEGSRLGTVVEWTNRTAEVAVEREIDQIVAAAKSGNLDSRISMQGKNGFFRQLGQGINELVDVIDHAFSDIAATMRHMADGDMTQPIEREYSGTFGSVRNDVNKTLQNIDKIVSELRDSTDAIGRGAGEISAGNTNLSNRTEQQASALQQTAASMEELTSTVKHNASNAQQANQLARSASEIAGQGGDIVGRAVEAMGEINTSSNRIAEIIGVIDEIAFQTNLLALNASVEAARAGEQGRGFAVVATEVRNLAGRSATAAKEIKTLIQDSVHKVKTGTELVDQSGQTLEEIVNGVKKVGDIIAEIAAASAEQSAGIDQVNLAVTSMDEVTQQNAALAEQTSSASTEMSEKADKMAQLVGFFRVSGQPMPKRSTASEPASSPQVKVTRPAPPRPRPAPAESISMRTQPARIHEARPVAAPPQADDDDEWEEF